MYFGLEIRRYLGVGLVPAATLLLLSGCASRGGSVPYDVQNFGPPDAENLTLVDSQQRIAPLDKLRIDVFQEAELSGEFQVDSGGRIQYPLLGGVQAQGLSTDELARQLTERLSQNYLRSPNVRVAVAERVPQTITIDGSVRQPGVVPIQGATTLIRAVALGRGTAEDANPSRVVVFRTINGQRMAAAFDLQAIRRGEADDPPIFGNDVIVVDGNSSRAIFRDVLSAIPILGVFRPF